MPNWKRALGLSVALASSASISSALAQEFNPQQIRMIRDTAASICNTIKEAKGQKSDVQLEGDVKAQLGGLVGKLVDIGGAAKGSLSREEFEGLSRDATAAALGEDRGCRERVFNKMFDHLVTPPASSRSDNTSEIAKAETLIAAIDLGFHAKHDLAASWLAGEHSNAAFYLHDEDKINDETRRLHIPPYAFVRPSIPSVAAPYTNIIGPDTYRDLDLYLRHNILQPDVLEAYEAGSDLGRLYSCSERYVYVVSTHKSASDKLQLDPLVENKGMWGTRYRQPTASLWDPNNSGLLALCAAGGLNDLKRELASLNLGDVVTQLHIDQLNPLNIEQNHGSEDVLASLHSLIRNKYESVSVAH